MIKNVYVFVVEVDGDLIFFRCSFVSLNDGLRFSICLKWILVFFRFLFVLRILLRVKC